MHQTRMDLSQADLDAIHDAVLQWVEFERRDIQWRRRDTRLSSALLVCGVLLGLAIVVAAFVMDRGLPW